MSKVKAKINHGESVKIVKGLDKLKVVVSPEIQAAIEAAIEKEKQEKAEEKFQRDLAAWEAAQAKKAADQKAAKQSFESRSGRGDVLKFISDLEGSCLLSIEEKLEIMKKYRGRWNNNQQLEILSAINWMSRLA